MKHLIICLPDGNVRHALVNEGDATACGILIADLDESPEGVRYWKDDSSLPYDECEVCKRIVEQEKNKLLAWGK